MKIEIEKNHVLLLYKCDAWHTHSSKELMAAFNDPDRFREYIEDMVSSGKLQEEDAYDLLKGEQTQGLDENYIVEDEKLNPYFSPV